MEKSHPAATILFFRQLPENPPSSDVALTSSLQSLETGFLQIALSRFPHALTAFATAIETAIRASGVEGKTKIRLLSYVAKAHSEKIAKYPRKNLVKFESARNRFIHQGFKSNDDSEASSLIIEVGLPFLWLCYQELHSFDAETGLLPEYSEQLVVARRVHALARGDSRHDLSYCFNSFRHLIRWCLRHNFSAAWEIDSLISSEEAGQAYEKKEEAKVALQRLFALSWSFDCPICDDYQAVVCEIDEDKLWEHEVVPARMACTHCAFAVGKSQPYLSKILLEKQLIDAQSAILGDHGID